MNRSQHDRAIAAARTTAPLPAALAAKLRRIPAEVVVCRDVDRLVPAARQRARGRAADPAAERHLEGCDRCRQTYGALQAAFRPVKRLTPQKLWARLRHIARRPMVPRTFYEVDLRLAAAASLFLGLLLQPVASDVAMMTRWTTGHAASVSTHWLDSSAQTGSVMLQVGHEGARLGLDGGATAVRAVDRGWRWLRHGSEALVSDSLTSIKRLIDRQGDSNGNTRPADDGR